MDSGDIKTEDPAVQQALARTGGGQPLPAEVRRTMELALGRSLDRVRIHTDAVAADAARAVRATAFTVCEDIFFAAGAYAPETPAGQQLLAHELTHVVQTYQGRSETGPAGIKVSNPGESLEREADAVADRIGDQRAAPQDSPKPAPAVSSLAARAGVMRQAEQDRASQYLSGIRVQHDHTAKMPPAAYAHTARGTATQLPTIYRDAHGDGAVAPHARELVDRALRGIAESLDPTLRARLEELIGRSLSDVRVHRDAAADEAAIALGARAFTIKGDIFFRERAYDPSSTEGIRLIAHEVAHTQQAAPEAAVGELRTSTPSDPAEREADALASSFIGALAGSDRVRGPERGAGGIALSVHRAPVALTEHEGGRGVGPPTSIPAGGHIVNEIGIVVHDSAPQLRLRGSPSTTDDNIVGPLPFNTRVLIIKRFPGDWLFVSTSDGRMGYCAATYVWSAPEHPLPEPNARLHHVNAGTEGTAIAIAQRYFGDVANDWGQDLRFYVNVIAAVNHVTVPSSVDGWRSVAFRAGQFVWIPSHQFARSMIGRVSSGSSTYEAAVALGIAGAIERAGELLSDFRTAIDLARQYIPEAVARHAEESIINTLQSLMLLAAGAVGLLALGALIGALVGGPAGAAAGFEVAMAFIEWLGLAFLVTWIATSVARIGSAFGTFIGSATTRDRRTGRSAHKQGPRVRRKAASFASMGATRVQLRLRPRHSRSG